MTRSVVVGYRLTSVTCNIHISEKNWFVTDGGSEKLKKLVLNKHLNTPAEIKPILGDFCELKVSPLGDRKSVV